MQQSRIDRLRKYLKENDIDALLVSDWFNIFYLVGFKTLSKNEREAFLIITKQKEYVITDTRYKGPKKITRYISNKKSFSEQLSEIVNKEKVKSLGFESEDIKYGEYEKLKKLFPLLVIKPIRKPIKILREIKDESEIEKISKACKIGDQCLKDIIKIIKKGITEKEIAFKIEFWLKKKGFGNAFDPIVAVDENSSVVHYDTFSGNNKAVKNGSVLLVDFGVNYENYLSDMTRVFFVGKINYEIARAYQNLLKVQSETISVLNEKKSFYEIDDFCRKKTAQSGLTEYPHSTGHGIGLQIHENPKISPTSKDLIKNNQVITIEPGAYDKKWGIRIEDTVLVGFNKSKILTGFDKSLFVI